jgi:hypothetical protein
MDNVVALNAGAVVDGCESRPVQNPDLLRGRCVHSSDGYATIEITERVVMILKSLKKPGKDGAKIRLHTFYLGFPDRAAADHYADHLRRKYMPFAPRMIVRERERTGVENAAEIKIWGIAGREAEFMRVVYHCAGAGSKFPV